MSCISPDILEFLPGRPFGDRLVKPQRSQIASRMVSNDEKHPNDPMFSSLKIKNSEHLVTAHSILTFNLQANASYINSLQAARWYCHPGFGHLISFIALQLTS